MRYVVFDLETQNSFTEAGSNNPADLAISVGCAYDSETDAYTVVTVDELSKLWPVIEGAELLVGYNSNHFDIPLLNKYYPGDLTHIKSVDLLEDIRLSLGKRLRLDSVAEATIGAKKSANGMQALRWWQEGKIDEIKKYCQQDVRVTKEVFEYALENHKVFYRDGKTKREIPIDTSDWIPHADHKMTHSLPF
jgi:DEAD/DEAH box helicase domain-containing protein